MILDEDVEFLEHFGMLGMHWGVRNAESRANRVSNAARGNTAKTKGTGTVKSAPGTKTSSGSGNSGSKKSGMSDKTKRRLMTGLKVAGGVAVVAGGALAARQLVKRHGLKQISQLRMSRFDTSHNYRKETMARLAGRHHLTTDAEIARQRLSTVNATNRISKTISGEAKTVARLKKLRIKIPNNLKD